MARTQETNENCLIPRQGVHSYGKISLFSELLDEKLILSKNRIKEENIVQYHVVQAVHQIEPEFKVSTMFCQRWLADPYPPGVVYRKTLNLCSNSQFIGNFKVAQYFVTMVGQHFQWLEFHFHNSWYGWKTMCSFCPNGWEKVTSLKL